MTGCPSTKKCVNNESLYELSFHPILDYEYGVCAHDQSSKTDLFGNHFGLKNMLN